MAGHLDLCRMCACVIVYFGPRGFVGLCQTWCPRAIKVSLRSLYAIRHTRDFAYMYVRTYQALSLFSVYTTLKSWEEPSLARQTLYRGEETLFLRRLEGMACETRRSLGTRLRNCHNVMQFLSVLTPKVSRKW